MATVKKKPMRGTVVSTGAAGRSPGITGKPPASSFTVPSSAIGSFGTTAGPGAPGVPLKPGYAPVWSPYQTPNEAPFGSYDPQLDTQGQSEAINYQAGANAFDTFNTRNLEDYNRALGLESQANRNALTDLQTRSDRTNQDYNQALWDTGLKYVRQGQAQTQAANAAGVGSGGALVAAAAAREANKGMENAAQKTAFDRAIWDIGMAGQNENTRHAQALSDLFTGFDRGRADRATQQGTADWLHGIYQLGLGNEKVYAAQQAGMLPTPPSNEVVVDPSNPNKNYKVQINTHNGIVYHVRPNGQKIIVGHQTPTAPKKVK